MPEEAINQEDKIAHPEDEDIDNFQADPSYSDFQNELGNHRAVVQVDHYHPAVRVNLPWRCPRDVQGIIVVDAVTGQVVNNVIIIVLSKEQGNIAFEPVTGPGDYYVYYRVPYPTVPEANEKWANQHQITSLPSKNWQRLPQAKFVLLNRLANLMSSPLWSTLLRLSRYNN